jgi:predicted nucleotidyltransferase
MSRDPCIGEGMGHRIANELAAIEHGHSVRVLLAVESGSRAWRFPSQDSDYDVRFIYAHQCEAYLAIEPPRDVIECPLDGDLDISGWDIRKALRLLVRSNAVLLEWLASPVRYRQVDALPHKLLTLAQEASHLPALRHHYDRLARHAFDDIANSRGSVRLKTYCYALRPVLALRWIGQNSEPPPMDLPTLMEGTAISDSVRRSITKLVDAKAAASEQTMTARVSVLDDFIAESLAEPAGRFTLPDRSAVTAKANALFASLVLGRVS